eukprot:CAMPEP_0183292202 /NCGR_PEP_ID=MMETSP0160_2-20130417/1347_1 /TAXON_ID=2839 ORGANISM="Odontella Sinensis, Strain Grunow 1884" /NCGR_SAMPLE_ID=MMETSP0160_2 /ASSEMBLY_ACC=CAM_ASM_000250 /LENGTH=419 /DNA_ID=CAMNT_0025453123 /DNA_START=22 /DNA_END=1278 /DNA_ORIENTATION=-
MQTEQGLGALGRPHVIQRTKPRTHQTSMLSSKGCQAPGRSRQRSDLFDTKSVVHGTSTHKRTTAFPFSFVGVGHDQGTGPEMQAEQRRAGPMLAGKTAEDDRGQRIEGPSGLAQFIHSVEQRHAKDEPGRIILVFDYDRTLTNGFASPDTAPFDRLRGGRESFDAISSCPYRKFVLTARPASAATVTTMTEHCAVLRMYVDAGALDIEGEVEKLDVSGGQSGITARIIRRGSVYASDYNKGLALAQIVARAWPELAAPESKQEKTYRFGRRFVYFVDDNVNNSFEVDTTSHGVLLSEYGEEYRCVKVRGIWWDTFVEEFGSDCKGNLPSMRPLGFGTDFSLNAEYAIALRHFGVSCSEREERLSRYGSDFVQGTDAGGKDKMGDNNKGQKLGRVKASKSVELLFHGHGYDDHIKKGTLP